MDQRADMQKVLDFIEENLKNDINTAELARMASYSEYHFLRLFRETVGLTPADYIRKRRITEIVRRMVGEKRPISDIAFEYGFNSKENFIRAFKREHHILPTAFRGTQSSLKLYERVTLEVTPLHPKVTILCLEPFRLVVYPCDEDQPPHFWNRYNAGGWSKVLSGGRVVEDFGVSDWDPVAKKLNYFIGIREEDAHGDTTGTVTLEIPGGTYAVFDTPPTTHFDFVSTIHRSWNYIGTVWLRENGYRRTGGYELESYTEESRRFSERIYIPITQERIESHEETECDL